MEPLPGPEGQAQARQRMVRQPPPTRELGQRMSKVVAMAAIPTQSLGAQEQVNLPTFHPEEVEVAPERDPLVLCPVVMVRQVR